MLITSIKTLIKKYFQSFVYFYRYLGYRIFLRMALSLTVGILDGLGIAMFIPLLQMADGSSDASAEGLGNLGFLVDGMESIGLELNILTILMIMSLFFIFKGLAQYINGIYGVTVRLYFIKSMRVKLSKALTAMSYKAFSLSDAGRIQNTMTGEVGKITQAYDNYFNCFEQIVMVAVYMTFAFFVDAQFALLICLGGAFTNLIFKGIYKATKIASAKVTAGTNSYSKLIIQFVSNFKYLKATGYIKEYNKKLIENIYYIEENTRKIGKLGTIVGSIREPILILVVSSVILIQIWVLGGTIATIILSLLFFYRALTALMFMQGAYNNFLSVSGSMDNMTSFEISLDEARENDGHHKLKNFTQGIELNNVSFKYSDTTVLKNINLKIPKNQTIAFVGESGSGKSTLVNILSGLMPVNEGEVLIDGIPSRDLQMESYQKRIGYITQEPVIFNDTIFNNITLWAEPTPQNLERFQYAMKQASILEFIEEQPLKEKTLLGNNGVNLSGGQKQRISIARELYKDADILILDEATSALDSETENTIQKGLDDLQGQYTIFIVAHRLSTIKNADRIIVMSRGEIIDEGTFHDLTVNSMRFKKMVELQEV